MPAPTPAARWRRRLIRAAVCLLLGAVTTVGVGWGAAWATRSQSQWSWADVSLPGRRHVFGECRGPALTLRQLFANDIRSNGVDLFGNGELLILASPFADERQKGMPIAETTLGRRMLAGGWGRVPEDGFCNSIAAGWPMRALWGYEHFLPDGRRTGAGLRLVGMPHPAGDQLVAITFMPAWPGLLVDTLIYAALWWTVLVTPGAIRRRLRRRRGQCPACGYDRQRLDAGALCPECGVRRNT